MLVDMLPRLACTAGVYRVTVEALRAVLTAHEPPRAREFEMRATG
jgi:hypothetical protein